MVKKAAKKKTAKKKKHPGGRPSKRSTIDLVKVEKLAEKGLTNEQLAVALDVSKSTIDAYIRDWEEFSSAIKRGKDNADTKVERSLFERACGYSCQEDKILSHEGEHTDTVRVTKHYPPDTLAAIFWLKNRRPDEWRDKQQVEHSGKVEHEHNLSAASEKELDGILRGTIKDAIVRAKKDAGKGSGRKG